MKVLLVYSPYFSPHRYGLRTELLGPLYLAASLRAAGHDVEFFDPTLGAPERTTNGYYFGMSDDAMRGVFRKAAPDVVGVTCQANYAASGAYRVAALAKETLTNKVITVAGGLFPSVYKQRILEECDSFDFAFQGESDLVFPQFLGMISSQNTDYQNVDGLIYRQDGKIFVNEKKCFIEDLDRLPYPARDLIDTRRYMNFGMDLVGLGTRPSLSLLTSRSCPYRCTFCNMWLMHGGRWRHRSPENVMGEIDEMVHKYKVQDIFIMDDNFSFDPDRAKRICEAIIRKNYRIRWNTPNGLSARGMDPELARLMKRSGCANACIAIESGSEHIRNHVMKKNVTGDQIAHAVRCLHEAKVPVGGFTLLGMPGETEEHFQQTVSFVKKLPLSFITVAFVFPFQGTRLYDDLLKEGVIGADFDRLNTSHCPSVTRPNFETKDFTANDLLRRRRQLLIEFYSSHWSHVLKEFVSGRLNWFAWPSLYRFTRETVWESLKVGK